MGTADVFGLVDATRSSRLLEQAWDAGCRRFDTAPSHGFGRSELALGDLLARRRDEDTVVGAARASTSSATRFTWT